MTDETASPDPVGDPKGYQRMLLALLGADDPAEVQGGTPAAIRRLIADAGDSLQRRPELAEWSVQECISHLADAEVIMSSRYRLILAQDEPPLAGYDQDLWVERLHTPDEGVDGLLALFEVLRAANLALWRKTDEGQRARIGIHQERGPESYDLQFRMIAGHDRFHLAQAYRALDAAGGN